MSYVDLTNKTVKCRKKHLCTWCGEAVYQADEARYRTGIFEDRMTSEYQHPECYKAMMESDFAGGDGYFIGAQGRGKTLEESHG